MQVVNPLNKAPLSSETMVNLGCHCVCSSGRDVSYVGGWAPLVESCGCGCADGPDTPNYNANYQWAANA